MSPEFIRRILHPASYQFQPRFVFSKPLFLRRATVRILRRSCSGLEALRKFCTGIRRTGRSAQVVLCCGNSRGADTRRSVPWTSRTVCRPHSRSLCTARQDTGSRRSRFHKLVHGSCRSFGFSNRDALPADSRHGFCIRHKSYHATLRLSIGSEDCMVINKEYIT